MSCSPVRKAKDILKGPFGMMLDSGKIRFERCPNTHRAMPALVIVHRTCGSEITRKSYQMLRLIFRCGKYFRNKASLTLVRNRLEHYSTVWNPLCDRPDWTNPEKFHKNVHVLNTTYGFIILKCIHWMIGRRLENNEITLLH